MNEPPRGLSIVIPVYNSMESLPLLVEKLEPVLASLGTSFEVILINDGSRDRSWETVQQLAAERGWITGLDLMRNFGQHNALLCGIRRARYDVIVTMDDDLEHPVDEIPKLLAKLADGFDVVYGTPEKQTHGPLRDLASLVTKIALQAAMGVETARCVSAFRAFRTQVREAFANFQGPFVSIDVLLTWGTSRFSAITVPHLPRKMGCSNYTVGKLIRHALNMMTGFSVVPLQIASVVGFFFTLFGGAVLVYAVGRYLLQGTTVPGFPFLASEIAIFAGAQLFAVGVIGEYLARMHFRVMDRPPYAVKADTSYKR